MKPVNTETLSLEERISILEKALGIISIQDKEPTKIEDNINRNSDNIPIGMLLIGTTTNKPLPIFLMVKEDGYYIGNTRYDSLSAAAEDVSGVRRSGWTFWHILENGKIGRSVKEVFPKYIKIPL